MKEKSITRINRVKDIYKKEGLGYLLIYLIIWAIRRFIFSKHKVFYQCRYYFQVGVYYLYQHSMENKNEADFLPKVQNYIFKIVTSKEQADELVADGLDLPEDITKARHRLDKGAIAFCVFVDGNLAHIGWTAMTKEAKESIDSLPYKIDFSDRYVWMGGGWTNPKHRGNGFLDYSAYKRIEFLREMGALKVRTAVEIINTASNRSAIKQGYKTYAKGRYIRILRWKSWKETPINSIENHK